MSLRDQTKDHPRMPKKRTNEERLPTETKTFTLGELEVGITKLRRRIDDVRGLANGRYDDPRVEAVKSSFIAAIREVFGDRSAEYYEHSDFVFFRGPLIWVAGGPPWDYQSEFGEGVASAVALLEGLVQRLEEKRTEAAADPHARAVATIRDLDLHPRIADVAAELYEDGHYDNAVFDACKALINAVKEKSRRDDLDGSPLMMTVFSVNDPILAFNELKTQTERDEQQGMMHLFAGAVLAIRNPHGHAFPGNTADHAREYLGFLSLLAKRLQSAKRLK